VTTAALDGKPAKGEGPVALVPEMAITDIKRTGLIFIPAAGMDVDEIMNRNRPLLPWLRKLRQKGAQIAAVCSGVSPYHCFAEFRRHANRVR